VTALLALASALLVGGSDFLGGVASRRASAVRVAALAQLVSFLLSLPVAAAVGADRVTGADVLWSVASGLAVAAGLGLFYTAMSCGLISLVAPIAAVTGASVPVAYALARGERPGAAALVGIGLALPAIAIVSVAPARPATGLGRLPTVVALSVGAGALFGTFFLCLSRTSDDAGLWPVSLSRAASTLLLVSVAVAVRGGPAVGSLARFVVPIGALEMAATVTLLLALQRGPLAVASVLASLYPVTTVLLAAGILRERLSRLQLSGVALAMLAAALVSTA
jgi:uncharacterized membrane protein